MRDHRHQPHNRDKAPATLGRAIEKALQPGGVGAVEKPCIEKARDEKPGNGAAQGTLLVDGLFAGTWRAASTTGQAQLHVTTFARLSTSDTGAVTREGEDLLAFIAPAGTPDVIVRHE